MTQLTMLNSIKHKPQPVLPNIRHHTPYPHCLHKRWNNRIRICCPSVGSARGTVNPSEPGYAAVEALIFSGDTSAR